MTICLLQVKAIRRRRLRMQKLYILQSESIYNKICYRHKEVENKLRTMKSAAWEPPFFNVFNWWSGSIPGRITIMLTSRLCTARFFMLFNILFWITCMRICSREILTIM